MNKLTFGDAVAALKFGQRVCREGWNGKGMWITLFKPASTGTYPVLPCVAMKTAQDELQPGWNASTADIFAEDWMVLE